MKLRDAHDGDDDVRSLARGRHATWVEAVAGYLAMRKRKLLTGISDAASFEADKVRHRIKVLLEVGRTLGAELDTIEPKSEAAIDRPGGMSENEHYVQLAYLLTPLGWREKQLPALERRRLQAIEDWTEDKDSDRNLALAYEIERMIAFLQSVEQRARDAAGRLPASDNGHALRNAM